MTYTGHYRDRSDRTTPSRIHGILPWPRCLTHVGLTVLTHRFTTLIQILPALTLEDLQGRSMAFVLYFRDSLSHFMDKRATITFCNT